METKIIAKIVIHIISILLLMQSCNNEIEPQPIISLEDPKVEVNTILSGYEIIWGMDFLPNGDMIFTEKRGKLYRLPSNAQSAGEISGLPAIDPSGQGGLLDIKVHPDYTKNGWIYFCYTSSTPYYSLKLSRFQLINDKIENLQNIFTAAGPGGHNGSRILFDKKKFLFLSVGEGPSTGGGPTGINKNSSDPSSAWGKVHRLNDDGSIPSSNPLLPGNAAPTSVYTYGHRNPQGLALHPDTGEIWESEHGPLGGDEINIINAGSHYGWPAFSLGKNYDGTIISNNHDGPGITKPIYSWLPSIGTCGITFIKGTKFKNWSGSLLVSGLASQKLHRSTIANNIVTAEEIVLQGLGRIRNVVQGLDESIYVSAEGPGRIIQIKPLP